MYLSRYTKLFSAKQAGPLVLFSTANACAIQVPGDLISDIEKDRLSPEELASLKSLGLVTDDPEREQREMLGYVRELNALSTSIRIILVLNLDCNLACTYCFEGQRKGKWYLSDETADAFIAFIKGRDLTGKKSIEVIFYGGEPLLSTARIVDLSEKLGAYAAEKGLRYEFGLVTNGTLLTPEVVRTLTPLGLQGAKVTLDGPEDIHNSFRPFRSGTGSFDVILRNIAAVCDLIRIQIGGNYTREHYHRFPHLLDHLREQGLTPQKVPVVKFDPVMQESNEFGMPDFQDGCTSINEPWISEAALYLRAEVLKRGYTAQKIVPSPCLLEFADSFVVNYDGTLYKCPGLIGRKQCCVGDVRTGLLGEGPAHGLDSWKNDRCLACSYLPLCFGGCRYMQLLRAGTMEGLNCQKEYFDRTLGQFVSQDLEFGL